MKQLLFAAALVSAAHYSIGQNLEETYPKTLWCPNDTFTLRFSAFPGSYPFKVGKKPKEDLGTDAGPGLYVTVYYGKDSIRFSYHNRIPYAHVMYVPFESPNGKTTLRLHFNDLYCFFPAAYMEKNRNNVQIDIPEPYELANIIWTLSPAGQKATDLNKEGEYYKKVVAHFSPYLDHPLFRALDVADSVYFNRYYDFRENSFAFNFSNPEVVSDNTLLFNGPYYYVYGNELADSSLFGKLKPLVEDFAAKSGFRDFYKSNRAFYTAGINRQQMLLPVKKMWSWLEKEFPARKYQSYRIVFSPLIGGSHSTQNYSSPDKTGWFGETVMFICGTSRYDRDATLTEIQKEGLMSGVVFTEIDHNYVNPATNKYSKLVDSIFSNRLIWVKKDVANSYYSGAVSVFNEYMTHAAFCLYMLDTYDAATAGFVIDHRETMMVSRRNFIRFKEFNRELIRLRKEQKNLTMNELYPLILEWCKTQR